ncbi:hypothetical protein GE09DRAFT_1216191 [Coniochaeta sp. 2T2.1]|nr:hypothetical protein GE09DRAFT_1216191 [Coniochaeta sp. 2T2.1]
MSTDRDFNDNAEATGDEAGNERTGNESNNRQGTDNRGPDEQGTDNGDTRDERTRNNPAAMEPASTTTQLNELIATREMFQEQLRMTYEAMSSLEAIAATRIIEGRSPHPSTDRELQEFAETIKALEDEVEKLNQDIVNLFGTGAATATGSENR